MTVKYAAAVGCVIASIAGGRFVAPHGVAAAQMAAPRVEPLTEVVAEGGDVRRVHLTANGNTLVTMGEFMLHVWDLPSGSLRFTRTIVYPDNRLRDFAVEEVTGIIAYLVSGDANRVVFADLTTGERIHPAGGTAWEWALPAEWFPVSVDVLSRDDRVGKVAVADAYGSIGILDVDNDDTVMLTVDGRIRTVHWLGTGALLWAGPRGVGVVLGEERYFAPVTNRGVYSFEDEVLLERFVEGAPAVVGYNAGEWATRIATEPSATRGAVSLLTNGTEYRSTDRYADTAGIARGVTEDGTVWHLQADSSGELELRAGDGVVWAGETVSGIEEAAELPANVLAATPDGRQVAIARDVVVTVYDLASAFEEARLP